MSTDETVKVTRKRDGFTVTTKKRFVYKNGYSAWDGYKTVNQYTITSPSGCEYSGSKSNEILALAREVEPVAARVAAGEIRTENELVAALDAIHCYHMKRSSGSTRDVYFGLLFKMREVSGG